MSPVSVIRHAGARNIGRSRDTHAGSHGPERIFLESLRKIPRPSAADRPAAAISTHFLAILLVHRLLLSLTVTREAGPGPSTI
jgi:hypothetical protein